MTDSAPADPSPPTGPPPPAGRLLVITGPLGPGCHRLAWAIARRLEQSVVLDGPILAGLVASERASAADELGQVRTALLRYCGEVALAETYRRAGYDVIVVEDLPGRRLGDFVDLASPDDIYLVVVDGSQATYPRGLRVTSSADTEALAESVLARLPTALLPGPPPSSDDDQP